MEPHYIGDETERALRNFPFSSPPVAREFIVAIATIKQAAATAHAEVGELDPERAAAIEHACRDVVTGRLDAEFTLPALQGGAGTSINMNVNEVVANRATESLRTRGQPLLVHPNDHVNRSQSTNDVNPSALKVASVRLIDRLLTVLDEVVATFTAKATEFADVVKLGRTHLQDAVPTTLGAEFQAFADTLERDRNRLAAVRPYFLELNLGGTAIGNSLNASPAFRRSLYRSLTELTGIKFRPAPNQMAQTSSQTDFVMLSQALTLLALDASKIANDLRLLSSGPSGGLGEITLAALQKGSSIMPGKVNPVLPEAVNQLYFWVSGNNLSLEHAAQASQLELGVMGPTIADSLIRSLTLTAEVLASFARDCVARITANRERCRELLERSTAYATLLAPRLGYDTVTELVRQATASGRSVRELVAERRLLSASAFDRLTARALRS